MEPNQLPPLNFTRFISNLSICCSTRKLPRFSSLPKGFILIFKLNKEQLTLNSYKGIRSSKPSNPCLIFQHRIHFSFRITCSIINDMRTKSLNQCPSRTPKVMPKKYRFPIPYLKPDKLPYLIPQFKNCSTTPGTFLRNFQSPKHLPLRRFA